MGIVRFLTIVAGEGSSQDSEIRVPFSYSSCVSRMLLSFQTVKFTQRCRSESSQGSRDSGDAFFVEEEVPPRASRSQGKDLCSTSISSSLQCSSWTIM